MPSAGDDVAAAPDEGFSAAREEHDVIALDAIEAGQMQVVGIEDSRCCLFATAIACMHSGRRVRMPAARSPKACGAATASFALGTRRRFRCGPERS